MQWRSQDFIYGCPPINATGTYMIKEKKSNDRVRIIHYYSCPLRALKRCMIDSLKIEANTSFSITN